MWQRITKIITEKAVKYIPLNIKDVSHTLEKKKILNAHNELKAAIKELSRDGYNANSSIPSSNIIGLMDSKLSSLDKVQLEEIARLYYQGNTVVGIEKNVFKAFEAWNLASDLGSIEAKYSKAMCLREGVGVNKNSELAFSEIITLAETNNYNLAHV